MHEGRNSHVRRSAHRIEQARWNKNQEGTSSQEDQVERKEMPVGTAVEATYLAQVRGDKLRLLYRQSWHGVFGSLVAAALWVALMWQQAPRNALIGWMAAMAFVTLVRTIVFYAYNRQQPADDAVLNWELPYTISLLASALMWGVGTVIVMPTDSLLHQTITYVFLIGLAGAALAAYGVFVGLTIGVMCAVSLPIIAYFLYRGELVTVLLGVSGVWFLLTNLRALSVHNNAIEQSFQLGHQLRESSKIAEWQARTDTLTGLNNRRAFASAIDALLRITARENTNASMILIDIDDFKRINDDHGHAAGDAALQHLANLITRHLRQSDVCGRLGGDEFAVLLPSTDATAARDVAEKLCARVADSALPLATGSITLSLSVGVADSEKDADALLRLADQAMYQAKRAGKNQVAVCRGRGNAVSIPAGNTAGDGA